ncbi:MAG: hypothetical protein GDA46_07435, partial [Bdellovibrionales bacterium]|nr:hypothetical protein [Bdellovibrionales bacterium]
MLKIRKNISNKNNDLIRFGHRTASDPYFTDIEYDRERRRVLMDYPSGLETTYTY